MKETDFNERSWKSSSSNWKFTLADKGDESSKVKRGSDSKIRLRGIRRLRSIIVGILVCFEKLIFRSRAVYLFIHFFFFFSEKKIKELAIKLGIFARNNLTRLKCLL